MSVERLHHVQPAMPAGGPAFVVSGLPALAARLRAASHACREDRELQGYDRIFVDDPFGNRIELLELRAAST